jgi:uncharacterized protein
MTSMYKKITTAAILLITVIAFAAGASTPEPPAMPRDYVVDLAGVIRSDVRDRLNAALQELEQKTTAQVLVLTVQSLDGQSIEEFAFNTKERWKLGQKGKDNGVLIVLAVQDRKYRLEIGCGLESVLPDSLVGSIGREYLVPYFRKGDYGAGVTSAAVVIIQTIANHEGVQITGIPGARQSRPANGGRQIGMVQAVLVGIFVVLALLFCITHPSQCMLLLLASQMGGGRGGWSGGSGGFGGGSFGGGGG